VVDPTVPRSRPGHDRTTEVALEGQQQVLRATFPGIRDSVKELVGKHMDSLVQKFVRNHDMKLKDEIERLAREREKLKEPWVFRAS
jgi:hypothetical protein